MPRLCAACELIRKPKKHQVLLCPPQAKISEYFQLFNTIQSLPLWHLRLHLLHPLTPHHLSYAQYFSFFWPLPHFGLAPECPSFRPRAPELEKTRGPVPQGALGALGLGNTKLQLLKGAVAAASCLSSISSAVGNYKLLPSSPTMVTEVNPASPVVSPPLF